MKSEICPHCKQEMPTLTQLLGAQIRRIRENLVLTQAELAERLGIDDTQLSRYERGGANPSAERLGQIAKALGVPISELFKNVQ